MGGWEEHKVFTLHFYLIIQFAHRIASRSSRNFLIALQLEMRSKTFKAKIKMRKDRELNQEQNNR